MRPVTLLVRMVLPAWCLWGGLCIAAFADEPLASYFEGLRQRKLFVVAETEAQRRLQLPRTRQAEQVDLTIELSKTCVAHAMYSTGDERQELWTQAEQIVGEPSRTETTSPFRVLLDVQRAMVPAARGAQLRWQSELFPLDQQTRDEAAAILREALDRLGQLPTALHESLQQVQVTHRSHADSTRQPAPARLYRLQREVDFAIATARFDLAKVLSPGADRVAALLEADKHFEALTRSARPDAIAWQSRVHRLDILRLRGEHDRLAGQVTALLKQDPPRPLAAAATAVLVRRWLDEDRPEEALAALDEYRQAHGLSDAPELQAVLVESLLRASRLAKAKSDTDLANDLFDQAVAVDAGLDGPWKARSALLLQQAREDDQYGPELAESVRAAHWAWQNGNVDAAITAYSRAAARAHQQGKSPLAIEFGLNIASAQVNAGRFSDAVRSLQNLQQAYPDHDRAAQVDLLRAYALGRIYEQQPTDENQQAYREALESHRNQFAGQPTHAEATWMLARLADFAHQTETAITLLLEIPGDSPHSAAAIARLASIFERALDQARHQDLPTESWEQRALAALGPVVETFPADPDPLSIDQARVARRLARILMYGAPPDFQQAESLLQRVIDSGRTLNNSREPDAAWAAETSAASQLQIISLAGQGRLPDARRLLDQLAADAPQQMLEVLHGLTDVAGELGLAHRSGVARMQLELAESLKTRQDSLPEDQHRKLDLSLAQAHAAVGQWQQAAKLYEQMLWKQPRDRQVVAALAQLYEDCGSESCLQQALKQWQTLESLQQKGSVDWLTSRYHLAACSHRLGNDETARKLIGVTRVLYPKLGTPKLKDRYEQLAAELAPAAK